MANLLENMVNNFLPPEVKQAAKQALKSGDRAAQKFINQAIVKTPLGTVVDQFKPLTEAIGLDLKGASKEQVNKVLKEGLIDLSVDAIVGLILTRAPGASRAVATDIANETKRIVGSRGAQAATKFFSEKVATLRNDLVRKNPQAAKQIKQGVDFLTGKLDDAIAKVTGRDWRWATKSEIDNLQVASADEVADFLNSGWRMASKQEIDALLGKAAKGTLSKSEEQSFVQLVKDNAGKLKMLADEAGVKSAKEIPNLLKFAKQLGDIIQNSPNYIKATAKGQNLGTLGNVGLSIFDLYQAYKDNNNTLIPKSIANAGRIGASLIPGNTIMKLLYGGLGYVAGEKLARPALQRLGAKPKTDSTLDKEIQAGIAQPGLDEELPEFIQGQSGKKYHVVGPKIYDFSTGRPVNIQQALQDADAYVQFQTQQTQDQLEVVNQQIADAEQAQRQGYNIPVDSLQPLYTQKDNLVTQLRALEQTSYRPSEYDSTKDLGEQYVQKVVIPQQQAQQVQQEQQDMNYTKTYEQIFNKIATDTYNDLDNYFTPENQAMEYFEYMKRAHTGAALKVSPEEFSRLMKVKAMYQLAPKIREQTSTIMAGLQDAVIKQREANLGIRKQDEVERAARAKELIDAYNAEETARSNRVKEFVDLYKAQSGRITANAAQQQADVQTQRLPIYQQEANTSAQRVKNETELLPYKQGQAMSETVMNASYSDLPLDTFLNTNQSVLGTMFPGTQQQANPSNQQKQNIRDYYNNRGQQ